MFKNLLDFSKKRRRKWLEAAIGAIITSGVGVALAFAAGVYTNENILQFIAGLAGAAFTGVLAFSIYYVRTEDRLDEIATSLIFRELGFDLNMLTGEKSERLTNLLGNLALYYRDQKKIPKLLSSLIDESLDQTNTMLKTRLESNTKFGWEDVRKYAVEVLKEAHFGDKILSTSYIMSQVWWQGHLGEEYLKAKRDAAGKGAEITQYFIYPDKESLKNDEPLIKDLAKPPIGKNSKAIKICAIKINEMPQDELRDLLLIRRSDNPLAFELDLKDRTLPKGFVVYDGEKIASLTKYFEKLDDRCPVRYELHKHQNFEDYINQVFSR